MLAEHRSQPVGNLAHRRVSVSRIQNRRHQIIGARYLWFGLLPSAFLLVASGLNCHAEGFIAPFSGNLYLKCIGGSSAGVSTFGVGTSPSNYVPYLTGLPDRPSPSGEVFVGAVTAGQTVFLGISTPYNNQTYWAFSNASDQASVVAFTDVDNSLRMGGRIIEETAPTMWLMHLDDAASFLFDDDDNDILIQIRLSGTPNSSPVLFTQGSLPFTTVSGSNPIPQLLTITGTIGISFTATASSGGNWLIVNPSSGVTPSTISASLNAANLAPGTYIGSITVSSAAASNGPQTTQVTLTVLDGNLLTVAPSGLTFSYAIGGNTPSETFSLSSPRSGLAFAATVSGGSWLSLSPSTGSTPRDIAASVNPVGLSTGTYTASITLVSSAASNPVQTLPVTLIVNPPSVSPSFTAAGIVNAASFVAGLTPGSLATLFGRGLSIVNGAVLAGGHTSLNGTSVSVGGTLAPLISVVNQSGQEQISFQVPFELQNATSTSVQVVNNGSSSTVSSVPVLPAQPGIFAVPLTPSGTTAAVIHLNGQLATSQRPAQAGEIVSLFLTGMGPIQPSVATGALGPVPPAITTLPVTVSVGGVGCNVLFTGYAPGAIGLYQINFQIPSNIPSGPSVTLLVSAGNFSSAQSSLPIM
jgi:uncharacterized protein (TIGR03437 family)